MNKAYQEKHEKLIKEENDLKDKLDNEVTKVKEKLEKYWSEINNIIKMGEKINLGLNNLQKGENNIIKTLSYVSKFNKNKKEIKKLFKELMRNIKFNFKNENDKCSIAYEEYYFNGIPEPKNIQVKDITSSSINLSWDLDNLNLININKNEIKYKIEIRKENENEKFFKVYEGNNQNYAIKNLLKNTSYEIRISSFYDSLIEAYGLTQNIKTSIINRIDSVILSESQREDEFYKKISEWCGYNRMELIYRGTRDGMNSNGFHTKCDYQGPTITLYKNDKGNIFGGYSSIQWTSDGAYHAAPEAFIFTLINIYNIEPTKFNTTSSSEGIHHSKDYGPTFGSYCDIGIASDFVNSDSNSDFPCRYQDTLGKGKSIFTGNFDNNKSNFRLKEIEVFKLLK